MTPQAIGMKQLQIDVPDALLKTFDNAVKKQGIYPSRSEAIRSLMRRFIEYLEEGES